MSNKDWGELELVSARIEELHERRVFAEKTGNLNRMHVLTAELRAAEARRARLIECIMVRLVEAG